jgi:hypothetical protein
MTWRFPFRGVTLAAVVAAAGTAACGGLQADGFAPQIEISQPQPGQTVSQVVTITAVARDNDRVVSVKFFIDGQLLAEAFTPDFPAGDCCPTYQATWNTAGLADGSEHTIRVEARDPSGNTAFHEIVVVVDNSGA